MSSTWDEFFPNSVLAGVSRQYLDTVAAVVFPKSSLEHLTRLDETAGAMVAKSVLGQARMGLDEMTGAAVSKSMLGLGARMGLDAIAGAAVPKLTLGALGPKWAWMR